MNEMILAKSDMPLSLVDFIESLDDKVKTLASQLCNQGWEVSYKFRDDIYRRNWEVDFMSPYIPALKGKHLIALTAKPLDT